MWEALGLLGVLALWGAAGLMPAWLALIPTRGRSLAATPLAIAAGIAGGALVPALGEKDLFGFGMSVLAALAAGMLACAFAVRFRRLPLHG
jgi:hypothetical protein